MSQTEKAAYFNALKAAGVTFDRHYREYKTDELKAACDALIERDPATAVKVGLINPPPPAASTPPATDPEAAAYFGFEAPSPVSNPEPAAQPSIPVAPKPTDVMAGARPRTQSSDEPVRVDPETGRIWYQEEVLKPAYPKPRGRRKLTYLDPGVETKTVKMGDYTETFEVAGDPRNAKPTEVKITLPSYQVGIYKDRRFPFRVVCYNGNEGFHREDVINYYGGSELVPKEVKRKYVENVLCYDMRSVIAAIQEEARRLQLQGRW